MSKKVVINACFGGFGLSDAAYEKLIEWGVPVRKYVEQERDEATGLWKPQPLNQGEVIFDRELTLLGEDRTNDLYHQYKPNALTGRYWDTWIDKRRDDARLVRLVEELGDAASSRVARLRIVEIPDDVEFTIEEYDGREHIAETHRTWHAQS